MRTLYYLSGRIGLMCLLLMGGLSLSAQCGPGEDTTPPSITQTSFINLILESSLHPACPCPGSTFIEDNALGQDLLVSDIVEFGEEFFPGLAPFFLGAFEDNCTADEDIIVRVTSVEHFPLSGGRDSVVVMGVLVDEAGNESIQDTRRWL